MQETEIKKYPETAVKLYIGAFICMLISEMLLMSMVLTTFSVMLYVRETLLLVSKILIVVKILKYDLNQRAFLIFVGIPLFIISQIQFYTVDGRFIPTLFPMIIGSLNVDFKRIAKVYFYTASSFLVTMFIMSIAGVIPDLQYPTVIEVLGSSVRHSFGLYYTAFLGSFGFSVMIAFIIAYNDDMTFLHYVAGLILTFLIFWACKTRVDLICMLILWIGVFVINILKKKDFIEKKGQSNLLCKIYETVCIYSDIIAAVVMTALTLMYDDKNSFFVRLNGILSGRLYLGKEAFARYTPKLFGQVVQMTGNGGSVEPRENYFFIDCSYILCLLQNGIIVTLIMMLIFIIIGKRYKYNYIMLYCLALMSLNCMIAMHWDNICINFLAVAFTASGGIELNELPFMKKLNSFIPVKK
ncbi:MAG: hypothetical protein J6F31_00890 [Oscillospiraceae bacterium]|nr:hypothetical protein [Oscillospiraceae bacterium]